MSDDVVPDLKREARTGIAEAVLSDRKSAEQLASIAMATVARGERMLFTRLRPEQVEALPAAVSRRLDYDPSSRTAILGGHPPPCSTGEVCIISAGSSDMGVADEARRTLTFYGVGAAIFADVGVAGLWRLLERIEEVRRHRIIIAVAGMEAALFSVVAGLVPGLVIAVPTSVGYGVAAGGQAALSSALASCAPGIVTVNIDNGFGAACAALKVLAAARPDFPPTKPTTTLTKL
jgi:NCAIR mutase (PurE)-related protein